MLFLIYVCSFIEVSHKVGGPQLDIKSARYLTENLKRKLSLTKRLLDFQVSKKNHLMAVDLSSLLPQSQAGDTSPHVPSSNVNAFHMSEFTSPGSLFEKESGTGFDSYMADCTSVEASYFKAESFYKEDNVEEFEKVDCDQPSPGENDKYPLPPLTTPLNW